MTSFRTLVMEVPATPLGLIPADVVVEHWCTTCRRRVAYDDLVDHARSHTVPSPVPHQGGAIE